WILVTESALLPLIQKEHFLNTQHSFCHSPQLSWGFSSVINGVGRFHRREFKKKRKVGCKPAGKKRIK
ncbi:MAG: hypothetical protein SWH54_10715, partial [Thermodesulfobacteriota bacterium]|nr:hypothetical protein [Thermodesulfobacteriota bacterium]